jgi:hypothetical protein
MYNEVSNMKLAVKIHELASEARLSGKHEAADAYLTALTFVEEYVCEQKEREGKEKAEKAESARALAIALVELYEKFNNNAD